MAAEVEVDPPFLGVEVVVVRALAGDEGVEPQVARRSQLVSRAPRHHSYPPDALRSPGDELDAAAELLVQASGQRLAAEVERTPDPDRAPLVLSQRPLDLDAELARE